MSNGNSFGNSESAIGSEVGASWWFRVIVMPRPNGTVR